MGMPGRRSAAGEGVPASDPAEGEGGTQDAARGKAVSARVRV